jgi:glycosyltransferase involved in cell wall biosynthesis
VTIEALPSPTLRPAPCTRLLVILPTYNEERSVGRVVDEVRRCLPSADVLVVDDGSTDGSADVARAAGASVLRLPYNLGVGGAMRAGYKYAARSEYDVAVQVDADGQHDPSEVPALLAALAHADVVVGARFAGRGDYRVRGPRRWAMTALAWSVSRHAGTPLTDVTSGFRACNARAMRLFGEHYPVEYLGDTVEALLIARLAGLRIRQVPVQMRIREEGVASQTAVRASLYLGRAVLAMAVTGMRSDRHLLARPAALALGASA